MADMSTSNKQLRSPKLRQYRMRRRAEQVDETRQRITEAAVKLHTTVGPAHTSISSVAEAADVTRLTVYRHFEDLDALFVACMGHWYAANPSPDMAVWAAIEPLEARARQAFGDLYEWFEERDDELYPIYRDWTAMPESAQQAMTTENEGIAAVILGADSYGAPGDSSPVQVAVARHLADFRTWHSFVIGQGLASGEAAEAAAAMLLASHV